MKRNRSPQYRVNVYQTSMFSTILMVVDMHYCYSDFQHDDAKFLQQHKNCHNMDLDMSYRPLDTIIEQHIPRRI